MPARVNADPNASLFAFEYLGAVRGRLGDASNAVGHPQGSGYSLTFAPLVELHEPQTSVNVLPSQYWRARISIEQGVTLIHSSRARTRLALVLTHESDHETAHAYSTPGFLTLNDVGIQATFDGHSHDWAWTAKFDALLYVLSCTEPSRAYCENFRGSSSFGGQAQLGVAWTAARLWKFAPFASTSTSGIVAHGLVYPEYRWLTRAGLYAGLGTSTLALFATYWLGHDVGIERHNILRVVGVGASFSR
jgi:hypothetical protein